MLESISHLKYLSRKTSSDAIGDIRRSKHGDEINDEIFECWAGEEGALACKRNLEQIIKDIL